MLANQHHWYLCGVTDTAGPPWVIPIDHSGFVIGRRPGVSLKLDSRFISGRHAELTIRGDRLFVTDLGSQNGIYINGERVRSGQLGLGDLLTLGDIHFRIRHQQHVDCLTLEDDDPIDLAELHFEWLGGQLDRLLHEKSAVPVLSPVYGLAEDAIVGCDVTAGSPVSGLETESKILQAAVQLGRESDVNRVMIACCGSAAEKVAQDRWVCLHAPPAVNTELELLPALRSVRSRFPRARIIVTFADLPGRSLRTLKQLAAVFDDLAIDLGMSEFHWDQHRFIQTANLKLKYVRLDDSLSDALFGESEAHRARACALADSLHGRRIRLAIGDVANQDQLDVCRALGVDFAAGSLLSDAQSFPDTGILTTSQVAEIFADSAVQQCDTPVSHALFE